VRALIQLPVRILVISFGLLFSLICFAQEDCGLHVTNYAHYTIWRSPEFVIFTSGMTIDADGSPRAYHPDNVSGLDDLTNAGSPQHWYALATRDGEPVIQGPDDPAPSYYVSMTSLEDHRFPGTSPAHFVNAEQVPYIALPPDLDGPELGDIAYVFNSNNEKGSAAIFADQSPRDRLGEGSIALARNLGVNPDARRGGAHDGLIYVVFLHSGQHAPLPPEHLSARSQSLRQALALDETVQCVADSLPSDQTNASGDD
jgi:Fungal chitosanase of glycosyl hydrolase group 75